MATPLLQKARQRKMIYFGAIAVLFTVSLIHREFLLKPQAFALQLRETARGEVELTSSAVRLMLTGSRGLAVTMLWYTAMDKQKRNEWHELELLVKSITKLQPHFITPWLYQGWNIAFNVAVESDRPADKYYYVSRGIELLSEGERRNRGTEDSGGDTKKFVFPGNPELRYFIGFTYQLKIGASDERLTMRSLLELSCIDPVERNPDKFLETVDRGKQAVDLERFALFTQKYPRLVRRLREQLGFADPRGIVKFLEDNRSIPNRFKAVEKGVLGDLKQSELKDPQEQFPILPPAEEKWPDPLKDNLTSESVDVYLICRTWYQFAQKPLPPPNPMPGVRDPDYDKMRYRVPKQMVTQLFRYYPARAQVYIAETLESEGFFDSEGWNATDWFERLLLTKRGANFANEDGDFIVGTDQKYHSRQAWAKGYEAYKQYGIDNGIYLTAGELDDLNRQAQLARDKLGLKPGVLANVQADWRQGELGASLEAHQRLFYHNSYRTLTNFDAFFYQAEGEKDAITASARKFLFQAERKRKRETPDEVMVNLYDLGWSLYVHAALAHPQFAQVTSMQEDLYEVYQLYLAEKQKLESEVFKAAAVWFADHAAGPLTRYPEAIALYHVTNPADSAEEKMAKVKKHLAAWFAVHASGPMASIPAEVVRTQVIALSQVEEKVGPNAEKLKLLLKVTPIRKRTGPLDAIQYYDSPSARELREALFLWLQAPGIALSPNCASMIPYPGQQIYQLTRYTTQDGPLPTDWRRLITEETHRVVAERLKLNR